MIRDSRIIEKIRQDCLNDKRIAFLTNQKVAIMQLAKYYMVISKDGKEVLKQFIDERSQNLIDKIDLEIESIINSYKKLIESL